ncbi:MAG: alpha/beta fold hydrolase [Campylobacterales bacterium]|nr:alpha/beta fold hydrolase [Campylobacterales bacterium]
MKQLFFTLLASFFVIYIVGGLLLYIFQSSFIYYPTPAVKHPFPEKTFINKGETIRVITLNEGKPKAIIYFGGNGESVAYSAEDFYENFPGYTVYLVNYRGYGGSSGTPTQTGLFSDAMAIYDKINKDHQQIIAIGRSLGSGVALYLASQREVEKLVLITPFESLRSVAQEIYPIFPMSLILRDSYCSIEYAEKVSAKKTLLLVAGDDRIISPHHAYRLASHFVPEDITIQVIEGKGHNTISSDQRYYTLLKDFID